TKQEVASEGATSLFHLFFFDFARDGIFRYYIRVIRIPCDGERFYAQISGDIINRPAFSGA
ncbi:MAG: hypothetical protein J6T11_02385, partial [Bacteroidaceae bacterium]|nr:hypothetical protein [Bacteroidaceae bacterium]